MRQPFRTGGGVGACRECYVTIYTKRGSKNAVPPSRARVAWEEQHTLALTPLLPCQSSGAEGKEVRAGVGPRPWPLRSEARWVLCTALMS